MEEKSRDFEGSADDHRGGKEGDGITAGGSIQFWERAGNGGGTGANQGVTHTQGQGLRPIVIDGSNVAMGHGRHKVFS